jgi:SAM-dependent methyltransferase
MEISDDKELARVRARELAQAAAADGNYLDWFERLYREAAGDDRKIPWADLEPNRFFRSWAEQTGLRGEGRSALVIGCGLGDDAAFLSDLGFNVTAFDISQTAVDWARRLYGAKPVRFEKADLFDPPKQWLGAFDFVLEVYTIQPLPDEMRRRAIDAVADFVASGGQLVVVTRGRDDDDETEAFPMPLSRRELNRFVEKGLREKEFHVMDGDEEPPIPRFVIVYTRPGDGIGG